MLCATGVICPMQHLGMRDVNSSTSSTLHCFSRGSFMPAQAFSWNQLGHRAFLFYFKFGFTLSRCPCCILSVELERSFVRNLSWHPCTLGVGQGDFNLVFNTPISQELTSSLLCHCLLTVTISRQDTDLG